QIDDGSLHEAARELHVDAVKLLLKAGHNPDFPSFKHEGRSPLGELCLCTAGDGQNLKIKQTITALVDGNANPMVKWRAKSALLLALDNPSPIPVTTAFLESYMWKHINEEANLFVSGVLTYSPTTYVSKRLFDGRHSDQRELVTLLRSFGCQDRFFAAEG